MYSITEVGNKNPSPLALNEIWPAGGIRRLPSGDPDFLIVNEISPDLSDRADPRRPRRAKRPEKMHLLPAQSPYKTKHFLIFPTRCAKRAGKKITSIYTKPL